MAMALSTEEVRNQSLGVWSQFGEKVWIPNAKENAKLERLDSRDLEHSGIGKFAVLVGMGSSLEDNIETIIKYRDKIDVICCDKVFKPLIQHGVTPDYVVVADASIPSEYIDGYVKHTKDVKLLATPYANPMWTKTWLGPRYFYVNQDALETEQVFLDIMGRNLRVMPAGSNVSNAMLIFWTDCGGKKNANWGGYEKYFLVGYDYSWPAKGNYYAWNNHKKRYYMNDRTVLDIGQNIVYTSENLLFSAKWLYSYITTFNLPVYNCAMKGLLEIPLRDSLDNQLKKITNNKHMPEITKNNFNALKDSYELYKRCEFNFEESRRALLWQ